MKTTQAICAAFVCLCLPTVCSVAQDSPPVESIEELRREIAQLRQQVADLTERVEELEYQRLPGIRNAQSPPANSVVPVRPGNLPSAEPTNSKLRFPYGIERGNPPLPVKAPPDLPDLPFQRPRR